MQIEAEPLEGGILKISLAGRMDVHGAQSVDLKFTSHAANQTAVVVDMSAVDFLASIGIRTLLMTAKAVVNRGGKFALLSPNDTVRHVLEMAGIDTLIPVCTSLDEARSAVAA
jgi:anti-sigma B factor antagonist